MKKIRLTLAICCFGLATLLYLLDLSKITTGAGEVGIQIYPTAAFALLGLILVWQAFKHRKAFR